jgi:hypothetical protein
MSLILAGVLFVGLQAVPQTSGAAVGGGDGAVSAAPKTADIGARVKAFEDSVQNIQASSSNRNGLDAFTSDAAKTTKGLVQQASELVFQEIPKSGLAPHEQSALARRVGSALGGFLTAATEPYIDLEPTPNRRGYSQGNIFQRASAWLGWFVRGFGRDMKSLFYFEGGHLPRSFGVPFTHLGGSDFR